MLRRLGGKVVRNVRGVLFADYVRMIRGHKGVDWSRHLKAEDAVYLSVRIDPQAWYPMASFERLGDAILREIAQGRVEAVRLWGRHSVSQLRGVEPLLVAPGDPVDTLRRFRVQRATYFDFEALTIRTLVDDHAEIAIHYYMGPTAEEAACYQTLGFFEELLLAAGATDVEVAFPERAWAGEPRTLLTLGWAPPG